MPNSPALAEVESWPVRTSPLAYAKPLVQVVRSVVDAENVSTSASLIWAALVLTAVVHLYPCRRILGVQLLSRAACCGHSQSNTALTPCQMPRPPS